MATALVYVPASSKKNFGIGIDRSIWGWREETVVKADTEQVLKELRVGDYLLLGHRGPNPRVKHGLWAEATVEQLVVARLAGELYQDTSQVWPDDVYPYRVRLDILDLQENVHGSRLGESAMEALRRSANKQGAPVMQEEPAAVALFVATQANETQEAQPSAPADETDFYLDIEGDLDRSTRILVRREQQQLRRKKFGKANRLQCALCGQSLPARVVHTAHIKRRRDCNIHERRNLANIMGACVLGCDVLFEHGDLYVNGEGIITATPAALVDPGLKEHVAKRTGRVCPAFGEESRQFFVWHREHVAKVIQAWPPQRRRRLQR